MTQSVPANVSRPGGRRPQPAEPVGAAFLDAGGVLHLPDHATVRAGLAAVGVKVRAADLDRAHYLAIAAADASPSEGDWRTYQLAYARALGALEDRVEAAADAVRTVLEDAETWRRPTRGARAGLRGLARAGVLVVVVSNADGTVARRLADARLCQVGKGRGVEICEVLDSAVVGVEKPDARIFELALKAAGVPPERVAHVGDTVRYDVRGAEAAGVRPVHFDPLDLCRDRTHEHLADLRELPALFV